MQRQCAEEVKPGLPGPNYLEAADQSTRDDHLKTNSNLPDVGIPCLHDGSSANFFDGNMKYVRTNGVSGVGIDLVWLIPSYRNFTSS